MDHAPLLRLLRWLAAGLVIKVTLSVVAGYVNYLPPNFDSEFLIGRESHFFGSYRWAFYTHLLAGPASLVLGLLLMSTAFRRRFPRWHRLLGRVQVANVLLLLTPSGLWMAAHADAGPVAGAGFATLAVATAGCITLGWRAAVQRRYASHERWMWRTFLLLCSAVVIRLNGGLARLLDVQWEQFDVVAAWGCWLLPLMVYEIWRRVSQEGFGSPLRHGATEPRSHGATEKAGRKDFTAKTRRREELTVDSEIQ